MRTSFNADNAQDDGDNTHRNMAENITSNEIPPDTSSTITIDSYTTTTNLIRAASQTTSNPTKSFSNYVSQLFVTIKKEGRFILAFFKMTWRLLISLSLTLVAAAFVLLLLICYLMVDFCQLSSLCTFVFYVASSSTGFR
jgi:hypothetical protein